MEEMFTFKSKTEVRSRKTEKVR